MTPRIYPHVETNCVETFYQNTEDGEIVFPEYVITKSLDHAFILNPTLPLTPESTS